MPRVEHALPIIWVDGLDPALTKRLLEPHTRHLEPAPVGVEAVPLRVGEVDPDGSHLGERLEELLSAA